MYIRRQQATKGADGSSIKEGKLERMDNIDGAPATTNCLETFAKEKSRDGAGEQRVPARHGCREQRVL